MCKQNRMLEAIDVVLGWDLSDEVLRFAIATQAEALAARPKT